MIDLQVGDIIVTKYNTYTTYVYGLYWDDYAHALTGGYDGARCRVVYGHIGSLPIYRVYRPHSPHRLFQIISLFYGDDISVKTLEGYCELVFERENELKEMSVSEIQDILGYKIKVVEEK